MHLFLFFFLLHLLPGGAAPTRRIAVVPAGTSVPIRFLRPLKSGRDSIGTPVVVQTLAPLESERCQLVPAYRALAGRVVVSRPGRLFGGRGQLGLEFDSLEVTPRHWVAVGAVLDTLEYTPAGGVSETGMVHGRRASLVRRALPAGVMSLADVAILPGAVLSGYWVARRGPAARILAGEVGGIRLTEPLRLPFDGRCDPAAGSAGTAPVPELPAFTPWSEPKNGRGAGDPLNLIFVGTAGDVDNAFRRAGWVGPRRGSIPSVTREIIAGIVNRPAVGAPISTQYFQGRRQDLAYQISGPDARSRHHVRIWMLDSLSQTWVAAANEDVGFAVNPLKGRLTHRIAPDVDIERDLVVKVLESTGCAALVDRVAIAGAVTAGTNAKGQRFVTDGRTAVIAVRSCRDAAAPVAERQ